MNDSTFEEIEERQRIDREIFLKIGIVALGSFVVAGILTFCFWIYEIPACHPDNHRPRSLGTPDFFSVPNLKEETTQPIFRHSPLCSQNSKNRKTPKGVHRENARRICGDAVATF
jgi:hypothetical protein